MAGDEVEVAAGKHPAGEAAHDGSGLHMQGPRGTRGTTGAWRWGLPPHPRPERRVEPGVPVDRQGRPAALLVPAVPEEPAGLPALVAPAELPPPAVAVRLP